MTVTINNANLLDMMVIVDLMMMVIMMMIIMILIVIITIIVLMMVILKKVLKGTILHLFFWQSAHCIMNLLIITAVCCSMFVF